VKAAIEIFIHVDKGSAMRSSESTHGSVPALRVGVVGTGYWGSKHVRVLCGLDGVASVAVIDNREERLLPLARSFPSVRTFSRLADALPHVDALVVATPPTTHHPIALEAMAACKHLLF